MAAPVAFFAVFFAYPVAAIVARGLGADGVWHFGRLWDVLAEPGIRHVLWFTTWQALASTALTLLVALPGAYVFARLDFPGKQVLRAVVTVLFVLPTVVVGTAFLALVGRGGLLDDLWGYGWTPRCGRSCWPMSSSTTRSSYGRWAGCGRSSTRGRRRRRGCSARRARGRGARSPCPRWGLPSPPPR